MNLVLAGTSDARELCEKIKDSGYLLTATVVTDSAKESLERSGIPVRVGRLSVDGFVRLIEEIGAERIIDASHPFAEEAHRTAMEAAKKADIPYVRFERPGLVYDNHPLITIVNSYEEAARIAKEKKGNIMLTTGSKTLEIFAEYLLGDPEINVCCRMLPRKDNMEKCEALGFPQKNIIAMQGPFIRELNVALYKQYGTTLMITKESGKVGAVDEKVTAALELGIEVIIISRPQIEFGEVYTDFEGVLSALRQADRGKISF
jgi:precorrin-6A/cobalt-precorrin-6A reductase